MFHMANDSEQFRTRAELEEREGAWKTHGNFYQSATDQWVPLYEGKMVQAFDHRAASVVTNDANVTRPGQPLPTTLPQHIDANYVPTPRYWVPRSNVMWHQDGSKLIAFKDITSSTNMRTMIATMMPKVAAGHKLPFLYVLSPFSDRSHYLVANFNSTVFDYIIRQKINSLSLTLFLLEQLPVVPPSGYDMMFGSKSAGEIVNESVLELSYTAHDLEDLAIEFGHADSAGNVLPPFTWDEDRRLHLRAKLDALYFILYGVFDPSNVAQGRDDVRYIYSTFPIVEREEMARYGSYRSRDLCLGYLNALSAGQPDAVIDG